MRPPVVVFLLAPLFLLAQGTTKNTCLDCHSMLDGRAQRPALLVKNDVHTAIGLSC
jgi:hypothetical protein